MEMRYETTALERMLPDLAARKDCRPGVKMEASACISKWTRTAEIVETILIQHIANFGSAVGSSLCSREPAFDFRDDVFSGGHRVNLDASVAKKIKQLAQGKRAHVRGVTQDFPAVLIGRALWMLAGENIFNQHGTARMASAGRFAENLCRILHVMQSEPGNDKIELGVFERKILGVAEAERYVCEATLPGAFAGDGQHRLCEVDAHYVASGPGESFGDVTWTRGHIEDALVTFEARGGNEPVNTLFVIDPRVRGEGGCLGGERFANDVVVRRHEED